MPEPESTEPRGESPLRDLHRAGSLVLSAAMVAIGVAMVIVTLANGGGPLAIGMILGVLFVVGGGGRLWFTWRSQ